MIAPSLWQQPQTSEVSSLEPFCLCFGKSGALAVVLTVLSNHHLREFFQNADFFIWECRLKSQNNCVVGTFLFACRCAQGTVEGAQFGLTRIFQRLTGRCIDFCSKYLVEASRQTFLGQFLGSQFASQEMPDGKPPQETHIPLHRCPPSTVLKTG